MKKPENFKNAYYRKIPAYFNLETDELIGRNWFYDLLIEINVFVDAKILMLEEFPILIKED
ncbi:hypothetical protein [Apibacter adventoris]|uniref:Uncharacterized protein n=1 Tax=Apibacter adventoris TaxID=1679466 RepID=A0A2S8A8W6_9FLAO|nr:hypothetical protein [Apibacter adventoris]PQL91008.1 hypothetical protein C4S77_09120 [Apibacter adventoris]